MIYMDNAATTMVKPPEVIKAVTEALESLGNAGRGVNDASLSASRRIFATREGLAKIFGVKNSSNIAFTLNSTDSLNIAINGILKAGDSVVSSVMEHNSVIRPLFYMEQNGVKVSYTGVSKSGMINYEELYENVNKDTKMVVLTHATNLTGNMIDIGLVGEEIKRINPKVIFVVDASQTAGVYPIDVEAMKIDVLCFTGHKGLLGPQGTGGIYVRDGIDIRPLKRGGTGVQTYNPSQPSEMPTLLEAGTLNGHGIAGLGGALEYIEKTRMDVIREKELTFMWRFYNGIKDIGGVNIYGDFSVGERSPIVTLNIRDYGSEEVSEALLNDYSIVTRAGGHCAPLMHLALGTKEQGAVRFSFSHNNTNEEIDKAINAVREIADVE